MGSQVWTPSWLEFSLLKRNFRTIQRFNKVFFCEKEA